MNVVRGVLDISLLRTRVDEITVPMLYNSDWQGAGELTLTVDAHGDPRP